MNKKKNLLPIGTLAKSFGVHESTLRRMEDAGVLTPALISKSSGYRYYDDKNISRILTILALRSFGFVYEDIRAHLAHPGDFTESYEKLVDRQNNINLLIKKMGQRLKNSSVFQTESYHFPGGYYVKKELTIPFALDELSKQSRSFLYETVQKQLPVNSSEAMILLTDYLDFRNYTSGEGKLTFCIPLRKNVEVPDVCFLPPCRTVSMLWHRGMYDLGAYLPVISELFQLHHYKQIDTLRASYDVGGYLSHEISPEEAVFHILIPIADESASDLSETTD